LTTGGRLLIFKDMKWICVEIDGIFYGSLKSASKPMGCTWQTVKRRCLSDKFPAYKIVPFRITYTEKICAKCGIPKPLSEFFIDSRSKDERQSRCKACRKVFQQEHKEEISVYGKQYYQDNTEQVKTSNGKYYQEHKEECRIYNAKYREEHKEEKKEYDKQYSKDNPEKKKTASKKHGEVHREEINAFRRKKIKTDPAFRINTIIRISLYKSLKSKKNGTHLEAILGYTIKELIVHLESKFTEGMTWENHGRGKYKWNLDHEIPICKWDITSVECQALKDCWALDNLQPLWAIRNLQKGDRPMEPKYLIKPF